MTQSPVKHCEKQNGAMVEVQYEYVPAHLHALNLQNLMETMEASDVKTTLLELLAVSAVWSSLCHS